MFRFVSDLDYELLLEVFFLETRRLVMVASSCSTVGFYGCVTFDGRCILLAFVGILVEFWTASFASNCEVR